MTTTPPIDVARARAETPGCTDTIHFNNAGAALVTATTLQTQLDHLGLEARIGGYEAYDARADRGEAVYTSIATMLNAQRSEIALATSNSSALHSFLYSIAFEPDDRILTTQSEYGANYVAYLHIAATTGAVVEVVPNNAVGELDVDALAAMVDERVKLITVNHVPTNGGLVNDAAAIGRVAREHGILYLLDACQSAGQLPLDVEAIGCDALTATGRKYLRGPRGTGFLYVRQSVLETLHPPMIDHDAATWVDADTYRLQPDASRFESWERNWAALFGLGAAVDDALAWGVENIEVRVKEVANALRDRLRDEVADAEVHDLGADPCGIVTFSLARQDIVAVKQALAAERINVSVQPMGSSLLDTQARDLPPLLRASVHYYNTHDEIDALISHLS